jgi:NAD(P)-dependent dehydrogenase (short-subunit alcohol dehydrogenase family)
MAGRLEGKIALITGACSGIGLGALELFIAEGARVVAVDRQDDRGAALEKRLAGRVAFVHCDVTQEAEIAEALKRAGEAFGGLDILFNNAGGVVDNGGVATMNARAWDMAFALLLRAPALFMHHALPLLEARGGGSIINTASIAGLQAGMGPLSYSSAKAALIHLTRCAAAELAAKNIRVNAICPGLIATGIFGAAMGATPEVSEMMTARVRERGADIQPIKKPGLPEDIARAALYLASDDSAFVTGTHLVVDGGLTIGPPSAWDPAAPSILAAIFGPGPV